MKYGQVIKGVKPDDITKEMELVNRYSRRELTEDEVYLFSVVLCDNDIDRDYERFTVESLFALEKLFVGRTGIIDHDPTAKNQKARIISCKVESTEGKRTANGDQLFRLTARAYIRRTPGNAELIEAIEAGIVKEVSVGCSVGRTVCSICRSDIHSPLCSHQKGRVYDGELCFGELCEPKDAYEFSFVAVPAQRAAGVTKGYEKKDMNDICKSLAGDHEVTLTKDEATSLKAYIERLESEGEYAKAYREELTDRLRTALREKGVELDYVVENCILKKLSVHEAQALIKALSRKERKVITQLGENKADEAIGNTEFRI
ncbi:MAG: hypothetical protein IJH40_06830 [Ruminococcus sp.]|uniref:hypothetical protein n=1 Tax=Ruminococcus sp. TaxID=41978 RepID=UPI002873BE7B|nr:hypothetical protein [Ruminococcus sp.]MBQ3285340.1 hypothetical protein [Ruminococcus sp.]